MKYRKTGVVLAVSFWMAAVLQMLDILYPNEEVDINRYLFYGDFLLAFLAFGVYRMQHKHYLALQVDADFVMHTGHALCGVGILIKLFAEACANLHSAALLLNIAAILVLLLSMLVMLRAESFVPETE